MTVLPYGIPCYTSPIYQETQLCHISYASIYQYLTVLKWNTEPGHSGGDGCTVHVISIYIWNAARFLEISWPFCITSSGEQTLIKNCSSQWNVGENFAVSTVPADGLAPPGARASAGTVMTKFVPHIYSRLALEGLWRYDISNSQQYFSHVWYQAITLTKADTLSFVTL